jgi:hypothetical protein
MYLSYLANLSEAVVSPAAISPRSFVTFALNTAGRRAAHIAPWGAFSNIPPKTAANPCTAPNLAFARAYNIFSTVSIE